MRSEDLAVSPDDVLDAYYERADVDSAEVVDRRMEMIGDTDAYGRQRCRLEVKLANGRWYSYSDFVRMTLSRRKVEAAEQDPYAELARMTFLGRKVKAARPAAQRGHAPTAGGAGS